MKRRKPAGIRGDAEDRSLARALSLLLWLVATPVAAQPTLSFELSIERPEIGIGEPVVLTATIRNTGAESTQVVPRLDPVFGLARYEIARDGGTAEVFAPVWSKDGSWATEELAAGATVRRFVPLFTGAQGSPFAVPGEYTVRGVVAGVRSAPLAIRVLPAASPAQRQAAEALLDARVGLFLLAGGAEGLPDAVQKLEQVAAGDSGPLSAHAAAALGVHFAEPARDFANARLRAAEPARAGHLLEQALEGELSPYFRALALEARVSVAALGGGDPAAALAALEMEFGRDDRAAAIVARARAKAQAGQGTPARSAP